MHLSAHLDLDVVAHETDDEVSVLVELTAPAEIAEDDRRAGTLVVVLDRSGSMAGQRLEGAKTALLALVDRLDPRDRFGLVTFDNTVQVAVPTAPLQDKQAVRRAIAAVEAGGSTDLSAGYLRGLREAHRSSAGEGATLLLLSDGHANAGLCDPDQLGGIARKAHADGVTTTTLGFGLGYDERLLAALARGGAGNELFAESADTAIGLIAAEVDNLLSLTAQAVSLLVRMGRQVGAVTVVNELPAVQTAAGVEVELGSLYAGEQRRLVLTLDVPGIAALGLAEVARLELAWVALPALEQHTVTVPLCVNVVPGDQAAGRLPDPVVRTELAFQRAQRSKRQASDLLSDGDVAGAGRLLDSAGFTLQAACAAAPLGLQSELAEEIDTLRRFQTEATTGDVNRAAKLSSADTTAKSRTRGRGRPTG